MMVGDRWCPSCDQETLVEHGSTKWICLNTECQEIHREEDLDDGEE